MKKKVFYSFVIFITLVLLFFLNSEGLRYTGVNYNVTSEKISNFKKINDLFERDKNYRLLVDEIKGSEKNKHKQIIKISTWVYTNIKKINYDTNEDIIDSHPWTIIERRIGVEDQFSDILSVLFVYSDIDSFFIDDFNVERNPITFFKYNNNWSLIDPYYGIYFLNEEDKFCKLSEHKSKKCFFYHLEFGKISEDLLDKIFFNKKFKNLKELNNYYFSNFKDTASEKEIDNTNIYKRGGRAYIQKPFHRLIYQIQNYLNII